MLPCYLAGFFVSRVLQCCDSVLLLSHRETPTTRKELDMTNHTAQSVIMASPRFVELSTEEALKVIAKTNGQTLELTKKAFALRVENVVNEVAKLVILGAEEFAKKLNAEATAV